MTAALDPGETHTLFVEWAETNGVTINGIAPAQFLDRGMGIVAACDLKKGDTLVHVRNTSLVHVALPSIKALDLPPTLTVHGKLAAALALWYSDADFTSYDRWQAVWPSMQEFQTTMPLHYPPALTPLLPPTASHLLASQRQKLAADYLAAAPHLAVSGISKALYTYTWLIVNTRTFYWAYPDLPATSPRLPKPRRKLSADDCYAMCPLMDYFNHSSSGCAPQANARGYSVCADRDYAAGEEVLVSYGPHTNDFLLVEYGFILSDNAHDALSLDHLLVPLLDKEHVAALKADGFFAKYTLCAGHPPAVCHRTQAMLRLLVLGQKRYAVFVAGDEDEGAGEQARVDKYLAGVLRGYERRIGDVLDELEGLEVSDEKGEGKQGRDGGASEEEKSERVSPAQKHVLLTRWKQIRRLVNAAVQELGR